MRRAYDIRNSDDSAIFTRCRRRIHARFFAVPFFAARLAAVDFLAVCLLWADFFELAVEAFFFDRLPELFVEPDRAFFL